MSCGRQLFNAWDFRRLDHRMHHKVMIPKPELEAALERAEQRGVRVVILTNSLRSLIRDILSSAVRTSTHDHCG
ncbi:MAG: phosphatidylserine/phosphatidylglycerophosphate/cardiolipin synthase-like enzyme [Lentimonas sp.]|jgi:phosphatidylserine/phosphatidylglycerophosphate/cardiolipin synthase-like enzyme